MKWYAEMLLAALIGAVLTFGAMTLLDDEASSSSVSEKVVDASGAESLVVEAVEQATGDTTPYADIPEAACPDDIPMQRGATFRCEALAEDRLIPVQVKVISDMGFLEVVRVG